MNAHEACRISEAALDGWDSRAELIPDLDRELKKTIDDARLQWDFDTRLAA